jgi:hypothetical protein
MTAAFPMRRSEPRAPPPEYAHPRGQQPISRVLLPTGKAARLVTSHEHVCQLLAWRGARPRATRPGADRHARRDL